MPYPQFSPTPQEWAQLTVPWSSSLPSTSNKAPLRSVKLLFHRTTFNKTSSNTSLSTLHCLHYLLTSAFMREDPWFCSLTVHSGTSVFWNTNKYPLLTQTSHLTFCHFQCFKRPRLCELNTALKFIVRLLPWIPQDNRYWHNAMIYMVYKIYFKTSHSFYRHWLGSLLNSRVGDIHKKFCLGTSPVAQWLRIHLPIQGTWVRSLAWELRSHMLQSS